MLFEIEVRIFVTLCDKKINPITCDVQHYSEHQNIVI